jgi:hypothetical protein
MYLIWGYKLNSKNFKIPIKSMFVTLSQVEESGAISCYPFQSFVSAAADTKGFSLLSGLGHWFSQEKIMQQKKSV